MFSGYGPPIIPHGVPTLMDEVPEKEPRPNIVRRFLLWIAEIFQKLW